MAVGAKGKCPGGMIRFRSALFFTFSNFSISTGWAERLSSLGTPFRVSHFAKSMYFFLNQGNKFRSTQNCYQIQQYRLFLLVGMHGKIGDGVPAGFFGHIAARYQSDERREFQHVASADGKKCFYLFGCHSQAPAEPERSFIACRLSAHNKAHGNDCPDNDQEYHPGDDACFSLFPYGWCRIRIGRHSLCQQSRKQDKNADPQDPHYQKGENIRCGYFRFFIDLKQKSGETDDRHGTTGQFSQDIG